MTGQSSFDALLVRLHAGDDAAAEQVFRRFARQLIARARRHLDSVVLHKLEPEDVMQSVFKSFFTRHRNGQFHLESWNSIWGILSLITLRKCRNCTDYFYATRRDARREQRMQDSGSPVDAIELLADEPTPVEAAVLTDTLEQLMRGLEDRERTIVSLHLQGYTITEISARVDRAERTVRRVLERVRMRLRRIEGRVQNDA
jgi:RNA polymerase sigma-70 factor, ECF subfamily